MDNGDAELLEAIIGPMMAEGGLGERRRTQASGARVRHHLRAPQRQRSRSERQHKEFDIAPCLDSDPHWSDDSDGGDDFTISRAADAWSWLEAEEEFPGIGLTDDDPEADGPGWPANDDDSDPGFASSGEWEDGDEPFAPLAPAVGLSRRDRIRVGHDPEKTSLWTARNKNKIPGAGAVKRRFAVSKKCIEAAVRLRCPCGYEAGGSFCVDRIPLRATSRDRPERAIGNVCCAHPWEGSSPTARNSPQAQCARRATAHDRALF